MNLNPLTAKIINIIHDDIYEHVNQNNHVIFLCGGADKNKYIRDFVRANLEDKRNIKVLYPEDLFIDILNRNRNADLLTLERFLAENCDHIFIIAESPGSLVELGAFVNSEDTINKVVAIIDIRRKKDKSFIMLGPVRMLMKKNKKSVIFYNKEAINELIKKLNIHLRTSLVNNKRTINTILGLHYFILLVIYFYHKLEEDNLVLYIRYIFNEKNYKIEDFEQVFWSALKLLHKERLIQKALNNDYAYYTLTGKGHIQVSSILRNKKIKDTLMLHDSIRLDIMHNRYYKQHRFP